MLVLCCLDWGLALSLDLSFESLLAARSVCNLAKKNLAGGSTSQDGSVTSLDSSVAVISECRKPAGNDMNYSLNS